jgi:hypothetical protein
MSTAPFEKFAVPNAKSACWLHDPLKQQNEERGICTVNEDN